MVSLLPCSMLCAASHKTQAFSGRERIKNTSAEHSYSPLFYPILPNVSQDKRFHGSFTAIPYFSPPMFLFMVCKCWQGCEVRTFSHFHPRRAHGHYIILNFLSLFMTIHPPSLCRHGAWFSARHARLGKFNMIEAWCRKEGCGGKTQNQDQALAAMYSPGNWPCKQVGWGIWPA